MQTNVWLFSRLVIVLAVAGVVSAAACSNGRETVGATATRDRDPQGLVDAYLRPYVESQNFSGAVLAIQGGRVLVSQGYGMASDEHGVPVAPSTRFQIASISKTFTAAAILLLVERRQLRLDDQVGRGVSYSNAGYIESGGRVTLAAQGPAPEGALLPLANGAFIHRQQWFRVTFDRDGRGQVTEMRYGRFTAVKVASD